MLVPVVSMMVCMGSFMVVGRTMDLVVTSMMCSMMTRVMLGVLVLMMVMVMVLVAIVRMVMGWVSTQVLLVSGVRVMFMCATRCRQSVNRIDSWSFVRMRMVMVMVLVAMVMTSVLSPIAMMMPVFLVSITRIDVRFCHVGIRIWRDSRTARGDLMVMGDECCCGYLARHEGGECELSVHVFNSFQCKVRCMRLNSFVASACGCYGVMW